MKKIICKKCGDVMIREERVDDTEKADISTEIVYVCESCGHEFIINKD
jgi:RNase P subunit RPR2